MTRELYPQSTSGRLIIESMSIKCHLVSACLILSNVVPVYEEEGQVTLPFVSRASQAAERRD